MATTQSGTGPRRVGTALKALRTIFADRGVVRRPSRARAGKLGLNYHKGYEVRFPMRSAQDAARVRSLLRSAGLKPGSTYRKRRLVVVPVYGVEAVRLFDPSLARPSG